LVEREMGALGNRTKCKRKGTVIQDPDRHRGQRIPLSKGNSMVVSYVPHETANNRRNRQQKTTTGLPIKPKCGDVQEELGARKRQKKQMTNGGKKQGTRETLIKKTEKKGVKKKKLPNKKG